MKNSLEEREREREWRGGGGVCGGNTMKLNLM